MSSRPRVRLDRIDGEMNRPMILSQPDAPTSARFFDLDADDFGIGRAGPAMAAGNRTARDVFLMEYRLAAT